MKMVNILSFIGLFFLSTNSCSVDKQKSIKEEYCLVTKVYIENGVYYIDADFVQFLSGNEAIDEAKKNGEADVKIVNGVKKFSVPGDFYVSNKNSKIRKLKLSKKIKFDFILSDNLTDISLLNTFDNFKKNYSDKIYLLSIDKNEIINIKEIFMP